MLQLIQERWEKPLFFAKFSPHPPFPAFTPSNPELQFWKENASL